MLFLYLIFVSVLPYNARGSGSLPTANLGRYNFTSIYQLGDSLSDTGNLIIESPNGAASAFARFPYDESFFNHPTGRCSNSLLMVDFLANALQVPRLNPYLNRDALFSHGVNFAVAGASALPAESLSDKNLANPLTNSALTIQLDWIWTHFNSICYDNQAIGEETRWKTCNMGISAIGREREVAVSYAKAY